MSDRVKDSEASLSVQPEKISPNAVVLRIQLETIAQESESQHS